MIARCGGDATGKCESVYQDKRHGKQRRVFNRMGNKKHRCTVCGTVKD